MVSVVTCHSFSPWPSGGVAIAGLTRLDVSRLYASWAVAARLDAYFSFTYLTLYAHTYVPDATVGALQ